MILTGPAIREAVERGAISIDPFDVTHLNPNSYNFHLGPSLLVVRDATVADGIEPVDIPDNGILLEPRTLYLAHTSELIGSSEFAMTLLGRSSTGRLGLFLNATADLGHRGASSRWTLEISVVQPLRIYRNMRVGQVAFWRTTGTEVRYHGRYQDDCAAVTNKDRTLLRATPGGRP